MSHAVFPHPLHVSAFADMTDAYETVHAALEVARRAIASDIGAVLPPGAGVILNTKQSK